MTEFTVPDFMPQIRQGTDKTPKDGDYLIQVAGYLNDGVSWVDNTPCVHPVLRSVAIHVNDSVDDETRQQLLLLAPRLIGTGETGDEQQDKRVSVGLAVWSARQVLRLARPQDREVCEAAINAAEAWIANPCEKTRLAVGAAAASAPTWVAIWAVTSAAAAATSWAASSASSASSWAVGAAGGAEKCVEMLVSLIDEYDRLTGRTTTGATVDEADWRRVADAMTNS